MDPIPPCYGIIPARYGSTRFEGKPLANILGKPMFQHVYERSIKCPELLQVVLATDDERIYSAAEALSVPVVMTRKNHPSGTDRVLEAAEQLKVPGNAVVINIQGDEPALEPAMLTQLIRPFLSPDVKVSTLARTINKKEAENPDRVKVVFSNTGKALYFSRSPIPYNSEKQQNIYYGHIGLYAFRMDILQQFVTFNATRLEETEKLEQLRLLENEIPIHVVITEHESISVDRPDDIIAVVNLMKTQQKHL